VETVDNHPLTNKHPETTIVKVVYTAVYNFVYNPGRCEWNTGCGLVVSWDSTENSSYPQLIHGTFA
jgi:hypothetical protein